MEKFEVFYTDSETGEEEMVDEITLRQWAEEEWYEEVINNPYALDSVNRNEFFETKIRGYKENKPWERW